MKTSFIKIIIVTIFFFTTPALVRASELNINIGSATYDLQDSFLIDVYLDTRGATINAISTEVSFDTSKLQILEVIDSDSAVNFWIEKNVEGGRINLSGITPGGFSGNSSKIISLMFETVSSGPATVDFKNTQVFLNDGLGTRESISDQEKNINISGKISQNKPNNNRFSSDTESPESFKPEVSRSTALFDNEWFLVFKTQDKNSGVSHYLIKEARFRALMFFKRWTVVESPYVLHDQRLTSFIAIKAVDKAGNEVVERVYPQNQKSVFETVLVLAVFAVIIFVILTILRYLINRLNRPESY